MKDMIFRSWEKIVFDMNRNISSFGRRTGISLGTTVVACLFAGHEYYIVNIGDSRAYCFSDRTYQLTKDQSYVQREIDMGRMTPEEAETCPKRNVLLQCIGASEYIEPAFYNGSMVSGQIFMLCSDGFRHAITDEEMYERLFQKLKKTEKDKEEEYKELKKEAEECVNDNDDKIKKLVKEFLKLENPTPELMKVLINRIEIHQDKQVDLVFNFKILNKIEQFQNAE